MLESRQELSSVQTPSAALRENVAAARALGHSHIVELVHQSYSDLSVVLDDKYRVVFLTAPPPPPKKLKSENLG